MAGEYNPQIVGFYNRLSGTFQFSFPCPLHSSGASRHCSGGWRLEAGLKGEKPTCNGDSAWGTACEGKQIPRTPSRAPAKQGHNKTVRDFTRNDSGGRGWRYVLEAGGWMLEAGHGWPRDHDATQRQKHASRAKAHV